MDSTPYVIILHDPTDQDYADQLEYQLAKVYQEYGWEYDWEQATIDQPGLAQKLEEVGYVFCILSPTFLTCIEGNNLFEQIVQWEEEKEITLVPILVRPADFQDHPLAQRIPYVSINGRAISELRDEVAGWIHIHLLLRQIFAEEEEETTPPQPAPAPILPAPEDTSTKRSIFSSIGEAFRSIFSSKKETCSPPVSPRVVTPKDDKAAPKETLDRALGPSDHAGSAPDEMVDDGGGSPMDSTESISTPVVAIEDDQSNKDLVQCSIFAPGQVQRGIPFLVQPSLHLKEQFAEALEIAQDFDEESEHKGSKYLDIKLAQGERLQFHLQFRSDQVSIDEAHQSMTWWGEADVTQFEVTISEDYPKDMLIGKVIITLQNRPIGKVRFKLNLSETATEKPEEAETESIKYRKAFVSYSSKDRPEVLKRTQMLESIGVDYFQDIIHLDPGDRWEQSLYKNIDDCDVFLLFWSEHSKASQWVQKEWEYALQQQDSSGEETPDIIPVILEGPPVPHPPKALQHLHFNDVHLYLLKHRK